MNRLIGNRRIVGLLQWRVNNLPSRPMRNETYKIEQHIKERETALEDEYVRRTEMENIKLLNNQKKNQKHKKVNDSKKDTSKITGKVGKLTDSGIIF
ncbi:putative nuclease [Tieghemostelium lacteum]|uniref:Putative nuclease n=1 Tax=Tieghemostelium lacteum TaxID=361077 RepID=A0A151Z9W9_TIELA|nr:putative nuclease [Tieghemostelium lacteum]|eukprot:KYQ90747.1 putative nuclease [Tieghemostelium lacteum]